MRVCLWRTWGHLYAHEPVALMWTVFVDMIGSIDFTTRADVAVFKYLLNEEA
jgi:hypothetical protein